MSNPQEEQIERALDAAESLISTGGSSPALRLIRRELIMAHDQASDLPHIDRASTLALLEASTASLERAAVLILAEESQASRGEEEQLFSLQELSRHTAAAIEANGSVLTDVAQKPSWTERWFQRSRRLTALVSGRRVNP